MTDFDDAEWFVPNENNPATPRPKTTPRLQPFPHPRTTPRPTTSSRPRTTPRPTTSSRPRFSRPSVPVTIPPVRPGPTHGPQPDFSRTGRPLTERPFLSTGSRGPHDAAEKELLSSLSLAEIVSISVISSLAFVALVLLLLYFLVIRKKLDKMGKTEYHQEDYSIRVEDVAHIDMDDSANLYMNTLDIQRLASTLRNKPYKLKPQIPFQDNIDKTPVCVTAKTGQPFTNICKVQFEKQVPNYINNPTGIVIARHAPPPPPTKKVINSSLKDMPKVTLHGDSFAVENRVNPFMRDVPICPIAPMTPKPIAAPTALIPKPSVAHTAILPKSSVVPPAILPKPSLAPTAKLPKPIPESKPKEVIMPVSVTTNTTPKTAPPLPKLPPPKISHNRISNVSMTENNSQNTRTVKAGKDMLRKPILPPLKINLISSTTRRDTPVNTPDTGISYILDEIQPDTDVHSLSVSAKRALWESTIQKPK